MSLSSIKIKDGIKKLLSRRKFKSMSKKKVSFNTPIKNILKPRSTSLINVSLILKNKTKPKGILKNKTKSKKKLY